MPMMTTTDRPGRAAAPWPIWDNRVGSLFWQHRHEPVGGSARSFDSHGAPVARRLLPDGAGVAGSRPTRRRPWGRRLVGRSRWRSWRPVERGAVAPLVRTSHDQAWGDVA